MRYRDLFENVNAMRNLQSIAADLLSPLAANGVEYVDVDQLITDLQNQGSGVAIDRGMLMTLLNPDQVKIVDRVEGDRVYLNTGKYGNERSVGQMQKDKEKKDIKKTAADQAKKNIQK